MLRRGRLRSHDLPLASWGEGLPSRRTSHLLGTCPTRHAMIPAPLLLRLRKHRGQRTPDPEVTIADHHLRRRQPAPCEVPQDRRPALRRFPIAALDGEDHLLAVAQRGQHDEDRGLVLLEAGLHVYAVHPEVDDVAVLDRTRLPEFVLRLPARLEARDRGRRQRRAVAEQPAQSEIEVALGQPMQVQLRQQPADFLRAPFERRQQPALEAFTQPAHPRAPKGDRAVAQAQPPWLAEAVAVARNGIDTVAPLVPRPPEHAVHLFFQHPLQELLHALPGEGFQRLPGRALTPRPTRCSSSSQAVSPSVRALTRPRFVGRTEGYTAVTRLHAF